MFPGQHIPDHKHSWCKQFFCLCRNYFHFLLMYNYVNNNIFDIPYTRKSKVPFWWNVFSKFRLSCSTWWTCGYWYHITKYFHVNNSIQSKFPSSSKSGIKYVFCWLHYLKSYQYWRLHRSQLLLSFFLQNCFLFLIVWYVVSLYFFPFCNIFFSGVFQFFTWITSVNVTN